MIKAKAGAEDSQPLMPSTTMGRHTQEERKSTSLWCNSVKRWTFLIITVVVGLFDLVTDWQNFIKYASQPEDLKEFGLTVAVLYFLFCCFIGAGIYFWAVWLAFREFKGNFDEEMLSQDAKLRDRVYKEKMYLSLSTIILVDFPCFLLNFFIIYCDSPENVDRPAFHLASWQTLAVVSSLVSVIISIARLLWLNYMYCKIFGCLRKGAILSSCCVWVNNVLAYMALAVMLYFFFGQFIPLIISFHVRQGKVSNGKNPKTVSVTKTFTITLHQVYYYGNSTTFKERQINDTLFKGVFSNDLKEMEGKGIVVKQNRKCSDIFYHVKPVIVKSYKWNPKKKKFENSSTDYYWRWKGTNCSATISNHGEILVTSCRPVWYEIKPVWCNFTYRIVYDRKKFTTSYNVANLTENTCAPVSKHWITDVLNETGSTGKHLSYCEMASRKWKPVWKPDISVC